jgi:hypothetical protein
MLKISLLASCNRSEINFLQGSLIFTLAQMKSTCSKILLLLTLIRSPFRYKWRWFNYKVMTLWKMLFPRKTYCNFMPHSLF